MKIATALFLFFYCWLAKAQNFSVKWGDDFKLSSGIFENTIYIKSVPTDKGSAISVFLKIKSFEASNDYIIAKINNKVQIESHIDLAFINSLKEGLVDIVKLKNNFFILKYRFLSTDKAQIVANRLNINNLVIEKEEKVIGEIDISETKSTISGITIGFRYLFHASIHYSPDSSKIVIVNDPIQKKKVTKKVDILVINDDLQKAYTRIYSFNSPYNKTLITNSSINNEGKVFLLYNIYEKDYDMMFYGDGDRIPPYTSHLAVIDEKTINNSAINTNGKFLHNAGLGYDKAGSPLLLGVYKDKYNGRLSGAVRADINTKSNQSTIISNITFTAFDQDLVSKIDRDDQGKKDGKKPGLDNDFSANYILSIDNGLNYIVLEYYDFKAYANGATVATKGNFVIITFLPNGKTGFQLIPRKQRTPNLASSTNVSGPGSYTPDYFEDKMILFYNDNEDNIYRDINDSPEQFTVEKKSALVVTSISSTGKLITRKIIYSHSGMDGFVTNLSFTKINDNTYLIYAFKAGILKHSLKAGILTIK